MDVVFLPAALPHVAMARTVHVEGFDELQKVLQDNQGQTIFVLFTGSKGPDGKSWCPDCVKGIFPTCCFHFRELAPTNLFPLL
jgi:Eukaryotic protein of unknown function (DUF953)